MSMGNVLSPRWAVLNFLALIVLFATALAQSHTVGLLEYDPDLAFNGYTLYGPMQGTDVYLIDMYGRVVHTWPGDYPLANMVYLLENGNILRTCDVVAGLGGGRFQEIDWNNNVVWQFDYYSDDYLPHHDIEPLPNGNVLILAREQFTAAEAIQAGRNPVFITEEGLSPEMVVEVQPLGVDSGVIVWEWHLFDHLIQDFDPSKDNYGVVADHYELLDINYPIGSSLNDWVHCNSVDYNPEFDQIILSSRSIDEIWIIDHSTTTEEAAAHSGGNSGMGGDILYRFGNPGAYRAGTPGDRMFFAQHDGRWIEPGCPGEGNIMVFNNGLGRPGGNYSSVDVIVPPVDSNGYYPSPAPGVAFGPDSLDWTYTSTPPWTFFSPFISGAERAANGNTVICQGNGGVLFEVTILGEVVWRYVNPVNDDGPLAQGQTPVRNGVFRITRYTPDYPGLIGKDLTPGPPLELYAITIAQTVHAPHQPTQYDSVFISSLVYSFHSITSVDLYVDTGAGFQTHTMFDDGDHHDDLAGDGIYGAVLAPIAALTDVEYYIFAKEIHDSTVVDPTIAPVVAYRFTVLDAPYLCGDADASGIVNVSDAVYLIAYVFAGGPAPVPFLSGDVDCNSLVNISDGVSLINYIFGGGPEPCAMCP